MKKFILELWRTFKEEMWPFILAWLIGVLLILAFCTSLSYFLKSIKVK